MICSATATQDVCQCCLSSVSFAHKGSIFYHVKYLSSGFLPQPFNELFYTFRMEWLTLIHHISPNCNSSNRAVNLSVYLVLIRTVSLLPRDHPRLRIRPLCSTTVHVIKCTCACSSSVVNQTAATILWTLQPQNINHAQTGGHVVYDVR